MTRRPPRVTLTDTLVPYRTLFRSRTHTEEWKASLLELARTRVFRTVIAYASRTGTRRNLDALRDAGWRLMVSARGVLRTEGFPYALDNGAWTSFQHGEKFDAKAFLIAIEKLGAGADFIVVPDIVCGGLESLTFSRRWWDILHVYPQISASPDETTPELQSQNRL